MKKYILPILIFISAFTVSTSAAFYSITGLSKLFSGESTAVIIMASSLEFSKIIMATVLHRYWKKLHWMIKSYLISAVLILVVITSAGIYGFLSNAYQITNSKDSILQTEIKIIKTKQDRYLQQKNELISEKQILINSVTDLRKNISSENKTQRVDKKSGEILTNVYTNTKTQGIIQSQIDETNKKQSTIDSKIDILSDSISKLDMDMLELEANSETAAELGPLKYLSRITGKSMDVIVNWFLLLLIFVFDPLAIVLVITANFAMSNINNLEEIAPKAVFRPSPERSTPELYIDTPQTEIVEEEPLKQAEIDNIEENEDNLEENIKKNIPWAFRPNEMRNTPHQDRQ